MVDLVDQLRGGVEKNYSRESLETMLLWAADEIERLRADVTYRKSQVNSLDAERMRLGSELWALKYMRVVADNV